jgi:hypothetical protein
MSASESLPASEAAAVLRDLQRLHGPLQRRTAGLMWMVWGAVAPAIFLTYAFAALAVSGLAWWFAVLWVPWVACGAFTTRALWRSAALSLPVPDEANPPRAAAIFALFAVTVFGSVAAVVLLGVPAAPPVAVLAALGVVSLLLGVTGLAATDPADRRLRALVGVVLLLAAAATVAASAGLPPSAAYSLSAVVGALASGAAFFGSGLYLATRG